LAKTALETSFKVLLAWPFLSENMPRVLVAFLIVLAPKGLVIGREGAAIRPIITFYVLPDTG
jgi:hypothetical protein